MRTLRFAAAAASLSVVLAGAGTAIAALAAIRPRAEGWQRAAR